jgi:hypothetical protein
MNYIILKYLHADDSVDEEQHGDQQNDIWKSLEMGSVNFCTDKETEGLTSLKLSNITLLITKYYLIIIFISL